MLRKLLAAAIVSLFAWNAQAATIPVTAGAGTNMLTKQDGSGNNSSTVTIGDATNPNNAAPVDPTKGLTVLPYNTGCAGSNISNTVTTPISATAGAQIVAGTAGQKLHICAINIVVSAADNVAVVEGTGSTCATGTAGLFGGSTAGTGWNLATAGQSVSIGNGHDMLSVVATTADNICLLASSGAQISGNIVTATY